LLYRSGLAVRDGSVEAPGVRYAFENVFAAFLEDEP